MKSATLMMCSLLCLYFLSAFFCEITIALEWDPSVAEKRQRKKKIEQINLDYCDHIVYNEDKKSGRTPLFNEKDLRTFCSEM